jgi:uncharacterized membrane protein YecN with MAPEG domain
VLSKISIKFGIFGQLAVFYNIGLIITGIIIFALPIKPGMFMDIARFIQTLFGTIIGIIGIVLLLLLRLEMNCNRTLKIIICISNMVISGLIFAFGLITYTQTHGDIEPIFEIYLLLIIIGLVFTGIVPMIAIKKKIIAQQAR